MAQQIQIKEDNVTFSSVPFKEQSLFDVTVSNVQEYDNSLELELAFPNTDTKFTVMGMFKNTNKIVSEFNKSVKHGYSLWAKFNTGVTTWQ